MFYVLVFVYEIFSNVTLQFKEMEMNKFVYLPQDRQCHKKSLAQLGEEEN
jgi:hypothetical protein